MHFVLDTDARVGDNRGSGAGRGAGLSFNSMIEKIITTLDPSSIGYAAISMVRAVEDVSGKAWVAILSLAAPTIAAAYFVGGAISDQAAAHQNLMAEIKARDTKIDFVYHQATKGERFTAEDGKRMEARLDRLELEMATLRERIKK